MRKSQTRGGDRDIVKQMNAAFRKPALTDSDEGKHFTSTLFASEGLLCKGRKTKGGWWGLDGEGRENESTPPPSGPLSSSQEVSGATV